MSSQRQRTDKPRSSKFCHFCNEFDLHNYCPTCREAGKGDDACVTGNRMCLLCSNFAEEQLSKIANRKRYTKKSPKSDTSRDESEILGEEGEIFSGSREELEESALQYYTLPPHPSNIAQKTGTARSGMELLLPHSPKNQFL